MSIFAMAIALRWLWRYARKGTEFPFLAFTFIAWCVCLLMLIMLPVDLATVSIYFLVLLMKLNVIEGCAWVRVFGWKDFAFGRHSFLSSFNESAYNSTQQNPYPYHCNV
jgi:hypothetical protein